MDSAEKSLMKLRGSGSADVQKELESIRSHLKQDEDGSLMDILKRSELRKALFICIVLAMTQELSGFCSITFYLQPIFAATGTDLPSEISALIVGAAMLVSSFIAPFLVDRIGRRILVITSCSGMCISLLLLGSFFYIHESTDHSSDPINWIPIFSMVFFIFSFNFGLCSVPWTLCSELFPNNVKQVAASLQSSICWITAFVMTRSINDFNDLMGMAGTFWLFAGFSFCSTVFCVVMVPETKGKSFSEIQDMLKFGSRRKSLLGDENAVSKNEIKFWQIEDDIK